MGARMSRFDFVSANLATSVENIDAARPALMDVDVAGEMANYSSKQVLMQASVAMLAQANQMPANLLRLLVAPMPVGVLPQVAGANGDRRVQRAARRQLLRRRCASRGRAPA